MQLCYDESSAKTLVRRVPSDRYRITQQEQSSQEDREARLDRQRLRTTHLTPRQRWVPQPVNYKIIVLHVHPLHCVVIYNGLTKLY